MGTPARSMDLRTPAHGTGICTPARGTGIQVRFRFLDHSVDYDDHNVNDKQTQTSTT